MAVTRVEEDHAERRSAVRQNGTDAQGFPQYITTHTRAFKVWTDDIKDGTAVAMTALELPAPGDHHDHDFFAFATGVNADPIDGSGKHFLVRVDYSDEDQADGDTFTSPLDRPWDISW
ncbi:MAG: hypothetical protein AAGL98_07970, partial [Planctomycetota bacterium]